MLRKVVPVGSVINTDSAVYGGLDLRTRLPDPSTKSRLSRLSNTVPSPKKLFEKTWTGVNGPLSGMFAGAASFQIPVGLTEAFRVLKNMSPALLKLGTLPLGLV